MVVAVASTQIAIWVEVLTDCSSVKTVSKSLISRGPEGEGERVSVAAAEKLKTDLKWPSLVKFLPPRAHGLNS